MTQHTIAALSAKPADEVPGTVFEVTTQELAAADRYEVVEYSRILATLNSGACASVLCGRDQAMPPLTEMT